MYSIVDEITHKAQQVLSQGNLVMLQKAYDLLNQPLSECDYCGKLQPDSRLAYVFMPRNSGHDGREGKYAFCRYVPGPGHPQKACPSEFVKRTPTNALR